MPEDCGDDCPGARRAYKEAARLLFNPGGVAAAHIFKARAEGHQGPTKKAPAEKYDWNQDLAVVALRAYFPDERIADIIAAVKDVPGTTEERYLAGLQKLGRVKA